MAAAAVAGRRLHADANRSISNTPSFKTHDSLNVHWNGKLQLLSNMSAGGYALVPLDLLPVSGLSVVI